MTASFPRLQLEEPLYGGVTRFLEKFPSRLWPTLLDVLLGGSHRAVAVDLPHRLARFREALDPVYPLSTGDFISGNSLAPVCAPFVWDSEKLEQAMVDDGHPHLIAGICPSGALLADRMRLCKECAKDSLEATGVVVWNRLILPDIVRLCPVHGSRLWSTDVSSRPAFAFQFRAAERASTISPIDIGSDRKLALWIAASVRSLCKQACERPGPQRLADFYWQMLEVGGYVNEWGRVRHALLMERFTRAYSAESLARFRSGLDIEARDNWLRRMCSANADQQPVQRHLLLMRFLGITDISEGLRLAALAKPRRLAETRKKVVYIPPTWKREAKRAAWLRMLSAAGGKALRQMNDALYCWLWRNDRAWLRAHSMRKPIGGRVRRNWRAIDQRTAASVSLVVGAIRKRGGRVSAYRIACELGNPKDVLLQRRRMPETWRRIVEAIGPKTRRS